MNDTSIFPVVLAVLLSFFLTWFIMYMGYVKGNYQLSIAKWKCIDAEIVDSTMSPAECSLFIRTTSESYKNYQRITHDSSN